MKFENIHSLDDIHKVKRHLKKKMRVTEKSISDRTDLAKLLLNDNERLGRFYSEDNRNPEMLGNLLSLGIKHVFKLIKKKSNKKYLRRILIYSAIGSVLAFSVYQFLGKRQDKTEE
jgi:hypothetical protein